MNEQENIYNPELREESVDYKSILLKFFRYWYFFMLSILIALAIAYFFNKFSTPVYEISSRMLINDPKKVDPQTMIGMGSYSRIQNNIQNEIVVIKSYSVVNRTIKKLNFYVSYFAEESFKTTELYKISPVRVVFDSVVPQPIGLDFFIAPTGNNEFELTATGENIRYYNYEAHEVVQANVLPLLDYSARHRFGEKIETPYFSFTIEKTPLYEPDISEGAEYRFLFNNLEYLTRYYRGFRVDPISQNSSIIRLSLRGTNVSQMADFLNMVMKEYLIIELEDKNKTSENTIAFIDQELIELEDSLKSSESELRDFMTENKVMNLETQTNFYFTNLYDLQNQKAELLVKAKYYEHLKEYMIKDEGEMLIPPTTGIEDEVISGQIHNLLGLYEEKTELLSTSTEKNPFLGGLNEKINLAKETLLVSIKNVINSSDITIKSIDERIDGLYEKIGGLPALDRELFNIQRQFGIKNSLYT